MTDMQAAEEAIIKTKRQSLKTKVDDFLNAKPSEMILMALDDLEAIEKNPKYIIDMGRWMEWLYVTQSDFNKVCYVCLAGAVMANRFSVTDWYHRPHMPPIHRALDAFRRGNIHEAFGYLSIRFPDNNLLPDHVKVRSYGVNQDGFKVDMRDLSIILNRAGF